MGNMAAVGEACGFAAALSLKEGVRPAALDGKTVSEYMVERGYAI
jgi:hypothetical protein